MSEAVIAALRAALEKTPQQSDLRLHLAEMLLLEGAPAEALEHAQVLLNDEPDNVQALTVARDACQSLGDKAKVEAYTRLLSTCSEANLRLPRAHRGSPSHSTPLLRETIGAAQPRATPTRTIPTMTRSRAALKPTFADVGGMDVVKQRLEMTLLGPLRNPELRAYYGNETRGGLLLYGPPGCGKTYIASAVAGELAPRSCRLGSTTCLTCGSATARSSCTPFSSTRAVIPRACSSLTNSMRSDANAASPRTVAGGMSSTSC